MIRVIENLDSMLETCAARGLAAVHGRNRIIIASESSLYKSNFGNAQASWVVRVRYALKRGRKTFYVRISLCLDTRGGGATQISVTVC